MMMILLVILRTLPILIPKKVYVKVAQLPYSINRICLSVNTFCPSTLLSHMSSSISTFTFSVILLLLGSWKENEVPSGFRRTFIVAFNRLF